MSNTSGKPLKRNEKLARLRLAQSEHVGAITFRQLIGRYGTAANALEALPELAARGGLRKGIKICAKSDAEKIFEEIEDLDAFLVFLGDEVYPAALGALEDAPPFLVGKGHAHLLGKKTIAIVGARNASANGQRFSFELAKTLGQQNYIIVSGLARGIDAHAHMGALESGTVAVLGGGIDIFYPKENRELQNKIGENGLVLTEHPPGTSPQAQHFPRRNRIIAGLAMGVVVVEAAFRSGSLITARLALEQGREVFAVPGHPLDPRAKGPNSLIRAGALLVESAEDVVDALNNRLQTPFSDPRKDLFDGPDSGPVDLEKIDDARGQIKRMLSPTATPVDDLLRQSGISAALLLTVLLELELAGLAQRHPGNKVSLV